LEKLLNDIKKSARIKQCIYPDKTKCNGKIKKSHAIQNNRILNKLAVNGEVRTMNATSNIFFQDTKNEGRGIATTFFGFCDYHDTILFRDIEDVSFKKTQKQVFLFTYRTFAWHYHKKMEQLSYVDLLRDTFNMYNDELIEYNQMVELGNQDNKKRKATLDDAITNEKYDILNYSIWEIPYEVQFAVSAMIELDYDLEGNEINPLKQYKNDDILKSLYINIFPDENKSFCILSWFKENNEYEVFANQFMHLKFKDKVNYMNNMLPIRTDKIIISPKMWNLWDNKVKESFISFANMDFLIMSMFNEEGYKYEYKYTPYNLFQCSSKFKR